MDIANLHYAHFRTQIIDQHFALPQVYQHTTTPLALPCKLVLPEIEPIETLSLKEPQLAEELLRSQLEAACNVFYLISIDTESLTGPEAIKRAASQFLGQFNRKLGIEESAEESKHDLKRSGSKKAKSKEKIKNKAKYDDKNDRVTAKFNESLNETKENQKVNQIDPDINGIVVYFKVASTGISLTDNTHRYAFWFFAKCIDDQFDDHIHH